ncbi:sirohydrochlorin cobaltochelatase [Clostridium tarantellae]|uniref:Sirohydrochlorin cobaltochelatase n=1 Tax=Clostridium tarantellae TaxID=39493 RepID=A0A6I1ML34_9CLOT|nr:sirohydrochlorin cobaltochelatase [Clostridium tarantellae]MPQ42932.1 sirohydrochlorin cobaltochelatase [Clostridium tarantellae]
MKKAILVVSFGTSYLDALKNSIEKIENYIGHTFKEYRIQRAFTSNMIIKSIKKKHNIDILTPEEALLKLKSEGVEDVIVQPLHIIPGEEFQYVKNVVDKYLNSFKSIKIGRPIFYFQGIEELPQDYTLFIESVKHLFNDVESTVLFGHGSANPSNSCYGCLQAVLQDEGYDNVFVGTVEGYPNFNNVLKTLKRKNIKKVKLVPLMVVAGDHAKNDMASEEEDSWKSMLESEGIKVKVHLSGLGELDSFNELYINRINDVIKHRYIGAGNTKKR